MATPKRTSLKWLQIDLAGLAVCFGITAAAYLTVYQPLAEAEAQRDAQQGELSARSEKAIALAKIVNSLRHEIANLQKLAAENPIDLQSSQHSNQRLADLTNLATEHGLDIGVVRTGNIIAGGRYDIVPIHLSGSGTYQSCTAFLHQLRSRFPDTGVVGLELTDNPGDPADKTAFLFDLTWYAATSVAATQK